MFFKNLLLYEFLYVGIRCGQHNHGRLTMKMQLHQQH